jgi:Tol biopolymer transport system component
MPPSRNVYTIRPDGSDRRDVTAGTAVADYAGQPTWMPDGRIIFSRGIMEAGGTPASAVIQPDGTGLRILDAEVTHPQVAPKR